MNPGGGHRVLVVDDDEMIRNVLAEALDDEGYETRSASNGREALDLLDGWRPDVILLDLMMPEMDGWAFRAHQRDRAEVADVPVIVLSARRDLEAQARSLAAAEVVAKPFDLDMLLGIVGRLVSASRNGLTRLNGAGAA